MSQQKRNPVAVAFGAIVLIFLVVGGIIGANIHQDGAAGVSHTGVGSVEESKAKGDRIFSEISARAADPE